MTTKKEAVTPESTPETTSTPESPEAQKSYVVVRNFIDLQGNRLHYVPGDFYPAKNRKTTPERIAELENLGFIREE